MVRDRDSDADSAADSAADTRPRHSDIEAEVRAHVEAGALDLATTRAIDHYGPELYGFLRAIARDDELAAEAFSLASEQLWKYLESFRWEASLRTWWYQIARTALYQLRKEPSRRVERNLPLSIVGSIAQIQRSSTAVYQRTEIKEAMRALREALDPLDHEIMILRLDRAMSWREIAQALHDDTQTQTLDQRAATLRKRFERAKAQLRELAVQHGLLKT